MEAAAAPPLDLSHAPQDVIVMLLQKMSHKDRRTCALVCQDWANAARAATRQLNIIFRPRAQLSISDAGRTISLRRWQDWLKKHQNQNKQLHECDRESLTALPRTPAQLQELEELLLHGVGRLKIHGRVWADLAAATSLVSVSLVDVVIRSKQAAVVSALAALPQLEQLTWCRVQCRGQHFLVSSALLRELTQLTSLKLEDFTAAAVQHLSLLTRLVHLSTSDGLLCRGDSGCLGMEQLKGLTSLQLHSYNDPDIFYDIPAS